MKTKAGHDKTRFEASAEIMSIHEWKRRIARIPLHCARIWVRSGHAIVAESRIGVHDVIGLLQNGETVETIVSRCFPNITRAQVYECLAYYEGHLSEIDLLVARQMDSVETVG